MADSDERVLRFGWEAVVRPPFGTWHPVGGGLEVRVLGEDAPGTLRIRSVGRVDVVHPDGTHEYWSTHCRCSGDHDACKATTINGGPREPAQAKCCGAPCRCWCHNEETTDA